MQLGNLVPYNIAAGRLTKGPMGRLSSASS